MTTANITTNTTVTTSTISTKYHLFHRRQQYHHPHHHHCRVTSNGISHLDTTWAGHVADNLPSHSIKSPPYQERPFRRISNEEPRGASRILPGVLIGFKFTLGWVQARRQDEV
ncbi:hypothetical protein E2C01_087877 [Portunus trituberculatus]|uniref:Uncharacterized protein n=1 Tax=Portunus trituberculatus TaxID=210409 RepID=A0A5B7J7S5_PORTR|nr:hypothetical protein [Portunus trituberculatus]